MSSLTTCIKKAGKALPRDDAKMIREIAGELGDPKAAIDEYLGVLEAEREELVRSTGYMPTSSSKFSQSAEPVIEEVQTDLEDADIRFQIEDDFVEQLVDKHPEHPGSQISKLFATVNRAYEAAKQPSVVRLRDTITDMSRTSFLASLPQTKLGETVRSAMPSVPSYVNTMARMNGYIERRLEKLAKTGRTWRKLVRSDPKNTALMGELMHESTRAATDPSKPFEMPASYDKMDAQSKKTWILRKRNHAILKKAWDKLPKAHQELFKKVRDDYAAQRKQVLKKLEKRIEDTIADGKAKKALIAELRKDFEAGKVEPYFPLQRFGKHWATVIDRKTKEVIAFSKFESKTERNVYAEQMEKAGYKVHRSMERSENVDNLKEIDPNFVAKITKMVGKENVALQDEIWQMYLRSLPERSARKAYVHRVGRLGYATDALRAYGYSMFHGAHQLGKLKFGFELQTHLDNTQLEATELQKLPGKIRDSLKFDGLEKTHSELLASYPKYAEIFKRLKDQKLAVDEFLKRADKDFEWAQPLADEMVKRHEYNMNPSSSLLATQLTGAGFLWFLSTSPAAGVLNLTQTAIVGLPTLGARFNDFAGAAAHLTGISMKLAKTRGKLRDTLRGDERRAFKALDHIFSKTRTRDMMGYAEQGENFASGTQDLIDIASWIFHNTEKWNREVTALAAYRMSREAGRSHEAAVLEAEEMVEMSHFDYSNTNRPRFMQSDGARVLLLFRNYSLNMTYRLLRDFKDSMPNAPFETQKEARKRFAGFLGMTFLFTGLSGMPLKWAFNAMADAWFGDDDEPFDSDAAMRAYLTKEHGEFWATFIMKGGWDAATNAQISNRASLNNLWLREVPENLTGKDLFLHLAGEATGPLGGIAANAFEGVETLSQGHYWRGSEKLVPKFVADSMKAIRYYAEGATNYDKDVIMTPEEFTAKDLFLQAAGFSPVNLTTRYEQGRAVKDEQIKIAKRRAALMDKLFVSRKVGDIKTVKETLKEIAKFNKANPRNPIIGNSIQAAAKTRAVNDMRAVHGVTVPVSYQYLQNKYRMTDEEDKDK